MGLLSLLTTHPLVFVVLLSIFLLTLSVHEASHALAGLLLGDPTAQRMHRLTLNPFAHIDPIGLIALITIGFGWGKPVPFNPYNLRWRRWGPVLVAAAGPFANLVVGAIASIIYGRLSLVLESTNLLLLVLQYTAALNFILLIFNLIPIPPLDGSKALIAVFTQMRHARAAAFLETQGPFLLILLVILDMFTAVGVFAWMSNAAQLLFRFFAGG